MLKHSRIVMLAAMAVVGAGANAAFFEVTWTNHGPQPLAPLFWSVGDQSFDIFTAGGTANLGIKNIAETGNPTEMMNIAAAAGGAVESFGALGPGPLMPGNTRTAFIDASGSHNYFSFASMLGMTNDGFIGESVSSQGLTLFTNGEATGFSVNIYGARAWDAGTELNTQDAADIGALGGSGNPADSNNMIRVHESIIPNVGDSWQQLPDWDVDTRLATVTVLPSPVPEPATMTLVGLGLAALVRRKMKK